ncbi:MAG: metallopeptidase family protein [Candidatus Colwellbacteria bacterium]|nr:metallopeptidase family protein [Candidatus Colwellbacteria bacterium]
MEYKEFKKLVSASIDKLPHSILEKIENVVFLVRTKPNKETRAKLKLKIDGYLLGLYQGIPSTVWGKGHAIGKLPDRITIFQGEIERFAGSPEEIPGIVDETIWHEVGHYLGLDDGQIRSLREKKKKHQSSDLEPAL